MTSWLEEKQQLIVGFFPVSSGTIAGLNPADCPIRRVA